MITEHSYREYLINLKDNIFKILPLYEEKSDTLVDYLSSLLFKLEGMKHVIDELPHDIWYVDTLNVLQGILHLEADWGKHKLVKSEVFCILRLIDKQIDRMKGE